MNCGLDPSQIISKTAHCAWPPRGHSLYHNQEEGVPWGHCHFIAVTTPVRLRLGIGSLLQSESYHICWLCHLTSINPEAEHWDVVGEKKNKKPMSPVMLDSKHQPKKMTLAPHLWYKFYQMATPSAHQGILENVIFKFLQYKFYSISRDIRRKMELVGFDSSLLVERREEELSKRWNESTRLKTLEWNHIVSTLLMIPLIVIYWKLYILPHYTKIIFMCPGTFSNSV